MAFFLLKGRAHLRMCFQITFSFQDIIHFILLSKYLIHFSPEMKVTVQVDLQANHLYLLHNILIDLMSLHMVSTSLIGSI